MPDYVTVIKGTAIDYAAGFAYDVNESKIVQGKDVSEAYSNAKKTLERIAETKHLPDLSFRLFELGKEIDSGNYA